MHRRDLLKTAVLGAGALALPPWVRARAQTAASGLAAPAGGCWITPDETEGPYYFDPGLVRTDVREGRTGVLLGLTMTVIDEACNPRSGALVDIWQCDKDGCYSGYRQPTCNALGQTFLRGTQITESDGVVRFTTIYPGWYPGRATHIHFKVRTATTTYKTSQFCFPNEVNDTVYASPLYAARGPNPTRNENDGVFHSAAPQYLIADVVGSPSTGYAGTYTIGLAVQTDVPGVMQSGRPLEMDAWPAPFSQRATIRGTLNAAGLATLTIFDVIGRRVRVLADGWRDAGTFDTVWDGRDEQGLAAPAGVYTALLEAGDRHGSILLVRIR